MTSRRRRTVGAPCGYDVDDFYGTLRFMKYFVTACRDLKPASARPEIRLGVKNNVHEHACLHELFAECAAVLTEQWIWHFTFGLSRLRCWNETTGNTVAIAVLDDWLDRLDYRRKRHSVIDLREGRYPDSRQFSKFSGPADVERWTAQQVDLPVRALHLVNEPDDEVEPVDHEQTAVTSPSRAGLVTMHRDDPNHAELYAYVYDTISRLLGGEEQSVIEDLTTEALHLYFDARESRDVEDAKLVVGKYALVACSEHAEVIAFRPMVELAQKRVPALVGRPDASWKARAALAQLRDDNRDLLFMHFVERVSAGRLSLIFACSTELLSQRLDDAVDNFVHALEGLEAG